MRRTSLALSALALSASLALAGCSGSSSSSSTASATASSSSDVVSGSTVDCKTVTIDSDSSALPTVKGKTGSQPTLTWQKSGSKTASAPSNLTVKTLDKGTGATVKSGDTVVVSYAGWKWGSSDVFDSSYASESLAAFDLNSVISGWTCGLVGHKAGERVIMSIPAKYAYGNTSTSGSPTGTLVFVVEIKAATTEAAITAGTAKASSVNEAELKKRGITVTGKLGSAATIKVDKSAKTPSKTEFIVIGKGTGEKITKKSQILTQMAYSTWDNATSSSSWTLKQPQVISMSTATGLEGLVGVPIGSRVVVLLPASSSSSSSSSSASSSATAFVIDLESAL